MAADDNPTPPDGGWGYVCIAAGFYIYTLFGMAVRAFGIIYLALLERFKTSASLASWVGATNLLVYGCMALVNPLLFHRFSYRTVTIAGLLLGAFGFIITGYAPTVAFVYLGFSLLCGLGSAMSGISVLLLLDTYFVKKKGLAIGIISSGAGMAMFTMPPLFNFLQGTYGYQGTMLINAGLCLQGIVFASLLRPVEYSQKKPKPGKTKPRTNDHEISVISKNIDNHTTVDQAFVTSHSEVIYQKENNREFPPQSPKTIVDTLGSKYVGSEATDDQYIELQSRKNSLKCTIPVQSENNTRTDMRQTDPKYKGYLNQGMNYDEIGSTKQLPSTVSDICLTGTETQANQNQTKILPTVQMSNSATERVIVDLRSDVGTMNQTKKDETRRSWYAAHLSLFKDTPAFLSLLIMTFFASLVDVSVYSYLPALAIDNGLPFSQATLLISWAGIMEFVFRALIGIILDLPRVRPFRVQLYSLLGLVSSFMAILFPFYSSHASFIGATIAFAMCDCVIFGQRLIVVADIVGPERTAVAFGMMNTINAAATVTGRTTGGVIKDNTGSYNLQYFIPGALSAVTIVIFLLTFKFIKKKGKILKM